MDALLVATGAGDLAAFELLVEHTLPSIYGMVLRQIGDAGRAQPIVVRSYADLRRVAAAFDPTTISAVELLVSLTRRHLDGFPAR